MDNKIKPLSGTEKKVLELHNSGVSPQIRIAEKLGIDAGTVSRALNRIEQDFPELMTRPRKKLSIRQVVEKETGQGKETAGRLQLKQKPAGSRRSPQEGLEQPQAVESKAEAAEGRRRAQEEPQEAAEQEPEKQIFSFRASIRDINRWKTLAQITGQTMERMGAAALNKYLDSYNLTEEEQIAFNVLMRKRRLTHE